MISRHATLLSASALALMVSVYSPAHAQQTAAPQGQAAVAQDPDEDASEVDEVIVTGVRASVASALEVKRDSDQISDSIVAEDIGKLPDNNVTEALSRVTGVQVQRTQGEGFLTLVRGLPNVVTTLNDRNIFTTTGRGIALADIPADLLQKVDVYKTAIPENLTGGIAGGINVDLRRPFDLPGRTFAATLRGVYSDQSEAFDPNGSFLISDRWDTGAGEFGALLSVSHQEREFSENNTFNGTYDLVPNPDPTSNGALVLRPFVTGNIYTLGERVRDSANLALQWRPNDRLELYFDGFYVDFVNDSELNFFIPLPGLIGGPATRTTLKPNSNVLDTISGNDVFTLTSNQAFVNTSETYQAAFGGSWEATDQLTFTGDIAYTRSTADNRGVILDVSFFAPRLAVDFDNDGSHSSVITNPDGSPFDLTDSSAFALQQLFDRRDEQEGDEIAAAFDVEYQPTDGPMTSIKAGVRFADRSASSQAANGGGREYPFRAILVDDPRLVGIYDVSPDIILDNGRDIGSPQFFIPNRDFLLNQTDTLRTLLGRPAGPPPLDPANFFDDQETALAGFAQVKLDSQWGSVPWDALFGLRVEKTESELNGIGFLTVGGVTTPTPVSIDKTDTEYLPSLNLRFELTDSLDLRFGAGRTVTRPNFADLNPQTTLTAPGPTLPGQGSGGNPNLENIESVAYDASLEWYFDEASLLSATVFYRDIKNFVVVVAQNEVFNGQSFSVSRPRSTGSGTLQGLEVSLTHFFDDLPGLLSGLGTQLNATFIDGESEAPGGGTQGFANVSELSYNAVLIYEYGAFSSRLAYNWRDEHIQSFNQFGAQPSSVIVAPQGFLDFSASYRLSDNFTLTFDAVNILDEEIVNYFGGDSDRDQELFPRDVADWERTVSIGLRARF